MILVLNSARITVIIFAPKTSHAVGTCMQKRRAHRFVIVGIVLIILLLIGSLILLIALNLLQQLSVLIFELLVLDCQIIYSFNLLP